MVKEDELMIEDYDLCNEAYEFIEKLIFALYEHYEKIEGYPKWIEVFNDSFIYEVNSIWYPNLMKIGEYEDEIKNNKITYNQVWYSVTKTGELIVDWDSVEQINKY